MERIGTCSIEIPDNLCYTLRIKIPGFQYKWQIKDYPETDTGFLNLIDNELSRRDFCLQNPEYHSPKLFGAIPAKLTGTLYYTEGKDKGLARKIKFGNLIIIDLPKKEA